MGNSALRPAGGKAGVYRMAVVLFLFFVVLTWIAVSTGNYGVAVPFAFTAITILTGYVYDDLSDEIKKSKEP